MYTGYWSIGPTWYAYDEDCCPLFRKMTWKIQRF